MAGIAGWLHWPAAATKQRTTLAHMIENLHQRGPDWQQRWFCAPDIGHRSDYAPGTPGPWAALAMAGREDEKAAWSGDYAAPTYLLVWDGELYNGQELRQTLQLHAADDGQTVLAAWRRWGPHAFQRLDGAFALALWDGPTATLILARDPLGVRPLFYACRGDTFIFGSELKALLAHPLVEPKVDREGLAEILVLGPARTPGNGVFKGVAELKAGQFMVANKAGSRPVTYWRPVDAPHGDDAATTRAKVRHLVTQGLLDQLEPLPATCLMLSGGLDSSLLTAVANPVFQDNSDGAAATFAVTYQGEEEHFRRHAYQPDRDTPWVDKVAAYLKTDHQTVTLPTHQLAAALKEAVVARDLPGMADIDTSLYLFCREIAKLRPATRFAISGEGADEVFGGYPWFRQNFTADGGTFPWSRQLDQRTGLLTPEVRETLQPEAYLKESFQAALDDEFAFAPRPASADQKGRDPIRTLFHLNLFYWLPTLLERQDRMATAAGLRLRLPFCRRRLVDYVWNIPWTQKNMGGLAKGVLRQAFAPLLPADVLYRQKSPYPKTHHPAYLQAVQKELAATLADNNAPLRALIDVEAAAPLLSGPKAATAQPWFGQLMAGPQLIAYLLQINLWLEHYKVQLI